jgi:hypothetical protein
VKSFLSEFDQLLVRATNEALATTVGGPVATAIKFYIDVSLVSKDIDRFRSQLNRFVPGSNLVEEKIMRNLAESLDAGMALVVSPERASDLKSFVESCRAEYAPK